MTAIKTAGTLATGANDDFLFAAYRIDGFSQLAKALVELDA